MEDTSVIIGILFFGSVLLVFGGVVLHYTEEIPNHEWEEMIKLPEDK